MTNERYESAYTPELRAKFVALEHGIKIPEFEEPRTAYKIRVKFTPESDVIPVDITLFDEYGQPIGYYPICNKLCKHIKRANGDLPGES